MSSERKRNSSRTLKFSDANFLKGLQQKINLAKKKSNDGPMGIDHEASSINKINEEAAMTKASQAEIELLSMKTTNKNLEETMMKMIKDYKITNTEHLSTKRMINKGIKMCNDEISLIKQSMNDILIESDKTKVEIREMRCAIENDSPKTCDENSRISTENITEKIVVLKNFIDQLTDRLCDSENQINLKNTENMLLRETACKLGNAILEDKIYQQDKSCHCQGCYLF